MNDKLAPQQKRSARQAVSPRGIAGLIIAIVLVVFVVMNREKTSVSFIFFTTQTALWIALATAGVAGFLAGFLVGRRRYR